MQVFKLVKSGYPDCVIGFDSLPDDLLKGITRGPIAGWQRHWFEFLSVPPKNKEAMPFYVLDYMSRNPDKQKWQEITSFVKRNVDPGVRLLDKIEAMAVPVASDSYSDVTVDPEDMPMIILPKAVETDLATDEQPKRRGRKPKAVEEVAA